MWQPVVSWSSRRAYAYESLLRIRRSPPCATPDVDFIDAAESDSTGRLSSVGLALARRIAEELREAPADALMFVNLHPSDLVDDDSGSQDGALAALRGARRPGSQQERAALERVEGLSEWGRPAGWAPRLSTRAR